MQIRDSSIPRKMPNGYEGNHAEFNLPQGATCQFTEPDKVLDGSVLMSAGLLPPARNALDSSVIELVSEK